MPNIANVPYSANVSTDSNIRYAAYASRFRTILLSAHRYVAYTSDVGESFRPIAHPWLIKSAYGISWAYLVGDVGHEGYKAYLRNQRILAPGQPGVVAERATDSTKVIGTGPGATVHPGFVPAIEDYRSVMVQRAVFQSLASMGLPAFTIHSIVRYSGKALKDAKNTRIRTYGPIGVSLMIEDEMCFANAFCSWAWLLYHSFHSYSISPWKKLWSGPSTRLSRHSVVRMLFTIDRRLAGNRHCRLRVRKALRKIKSYELKC